jgi:hypothetical protein
MRSVIFIFISALNTFTGLIYLKIHEVGFSLGYMALGAAFYIANEFLHVLEKKS